MSPPPLVPLFLKLQTATLWWTLMTEVSARPWMPVSHYWCCVPQNVALVCCNQLTQQVCGLCSRSQLGSRWLEQLLWGIDCRQRHHIHIGTSNTMQ